MDTKPTRHKRKRNIDSSGIDIFIKSNGFFFFGKNNQILMDKSQNESKILQHNKGKLVGLFGVIFHGTVNDLTVFSVASPKA